MDSAISRQIEKFKMGDFSGYQEFYDETVRTAYTMLRTIIPDEQMALAQIPAVYDSMYKNVNELERTELFYEWMGKQVNDVSLQCVDTDISGDGNVDDGSTNDKSTCDEGSGEEAFFDYAAEDEALTITEEQAGDVTFAGRLQQIVDGLTPMEKIVFQKYYYFGERTGDIAAKTGLTNAVIKNILKNTRTAIVSAIEDTATEETGEQKKYSLKNVPWLWIMFRNNVAGTVGLPYVGLSEFMMGIGGSSGVTSGAAGQTPGSAPGGAAGQTPGSAPGGAAGQVSSGMAKSAHGLGRMMGTLGGKITVGVISAAVLVAIGVGVHHVLTDKNDSDKNSAGKNGEDYVGTVLPEGDTGDTSDQWAQEQPEDIEEDGAKTRFEGMLDQARDTVERYQQTGETDDYYMVYKDPKKDCLYAVYDVDGDGEDELLLGCWDEESRQVELRNIIYEDTTTVHEDMTYYCGDTKLAVFVRREDDYELVTYKHDSEYDDDSYLKILQDGTWRYYNVGYVEATDITIGNETGGSFGEENYKNCDHDFLIDHINDDYFSGYYTEISEAQWNEKQQEYSYTGLEWKPLFSDETILTDDPDIPDSDGRF
ncbi:hypothetical protein DXB54_07390 [Coprococcus sp. OM04-5BH]|uniref:hypothetical protein n=1 Tax=Coprococcus sp. OM04-5BH TaxID=2293093 RepID=UPI000E4D827E|nr:hypothetical protein [Coprococcus sp. OM04-5BH]RHV31829.1 hypothetical protein DXB54_07390 [Coprococcus sp. OM04-5BH]